MVYFNGRHRSPVLGIREIMAGNFNPMCHHMLTKRYKRSHVQIQIPYLDGAAWITVRRDEIREEAHG